MMKRLFLILVLAGLIYGCAGAAPMSIPGMAENEESGFGGSDVAYEAMDGAFDTGAMVANSVATGDAQSIKRIVIKNAEMSIAVDDPSKTMKAIEDMAATMGGFVVSSNLWHTTLDSGLEVPRGNITVRVPAERLDEALEQIETGAGRVLSKNQSGQDVTREYTDLKSRLRNLEQTDAQLMLIMEEARRTEDVLSVYNQLAQIREQIEVIQGQIQYYEQSAAFSAISVEVLADAAVQPLTIGSWQPAGVAKDAIQALINTLKWLVEVFIWIVLYVAPVAAVLYIPYRFIVRPIRRAWKEWRQERAAKKAEKEELKK